MRVAGEGWAPSSPLKSVSGSVRIPHSPLHLLEVCFKSHRCRGARTFTGFGATDALSPLGKPVDPFSRECLPTCTIRSIGLQSNPVILK